MRTFYRAMTRCPKTVGLIFILLTAVCALIKPLIAVNYDMNDSLPPDTASTRALDAMDVEYDGGVSNARVMVKNVTVPEALDYKRALEAIDGVTSVTWLDGAALFSVTIAEDKRISAVDAIRALIGGFYGRGHDQHRIADSDHFGCCGSVRAVCPSSDHDLMTGAAGGAGQSGRGDTHQQRHEPDLRRDLVCVQRGGQHIADGGVAGLFHLPAVSL